MAGATKHFEAALRSDGKRTVILRRIQSLCDVVGYGGTHSKRSIEHQLI